MKTKTTIATGYRWRLIIIAAGCLFWAGYCVYDATISYPDQIERYRVFLDYQQDNPNYQSTWPDFAASKGWPTEEPRKMEQHNITTQWLMFALTAPIGVYCLALIVLWQRRFVAVDDQAIYSHGNRQATWDQITRIDASRWASKGIARVYYDTGSGEQEILLDDWKYERNPSTEIYKTLERNVDDEKFEGLADDADEDNEEFVPTDEEPATVTGDISEDDAVKA